MGSSRPRQRRRTAAESEHAREIGERITRARLEFDGDGLTQRELGDLLGVSERSVAAYESGEVIPYRFIKRLEEVLGKPAEWILHGTESLDRDQTLMEILDQLKALRAQVSKIQKS